MKNNNEKNNEKTLSEIYADKRKYIIDSIGKYSFGFLQEGFEYGDENYTWFEVIDLVYDELKNK